MVPVPTHPLAKAGQLGAVKMKCWCLFLWWCSDASALDKGGPYLFLVLPVSATPFDIFVLTKEPSRKGCFSFITTRLFTGAIGAFGSRAHCGVCTNPLASPIIFLKIYSPGYVLIL